MNICINHRRKRHKTVATNFNGWNIICKTKSFYILLAFLLITIALSIAVSIYGSLIKYEAKQKHLLQFYFKNNQRFALMIIYDKNGE